MAIPSKFQLLQAPTELLHAESNLVYSHSFVSFPCPILSPSFWRKGRKQQSLIDKAVQSERQS